MKRKGFMMMLVFLFAVTPLLGAAHKSNAEDTGTADDHKVTQESENGEENHATLLDNDQHVATAADMKALVEQQAEKGEFENDQAVHALTLHLTAVSHYEKQDKSDKVIKHMKGFNVLLDHQKENGLISNDAYSMLKTNADALIEKWDSLVIVKDGQAHAVVVISEDNMNIDNTILGWNIWNDSGSDGDTKPALGIAHTGKASVSIHNMKYGSITQSSLPAQPGPFEWSAYYFTPDKGKSTINLTLNVRDENSTVIKRIKSNQVPTADTAGEWEKITLQGEIPEEVNGKKVKTVGAVITIKEQQDIPVYMDDILFYQEDPNDNLLDNPGFEEIKYNGPAKTLVDYVRKSTGAKLPIKTAEELGEGDPVEGATIYIGNNDAVDNPDIDQALQGLDEEGFYIHPHDNRVTIVGPSHLGTQNGVYEFLERYVGVRWLLPGEAWEDVPQKNDIRVSREDVREEPAFEMRRVYDAEGEWTKENKLQVSSSQYPQRVTKDQFQFFHNLYTLFPVEKYGETHPEFYPNDNPPKPGEHTHWQPCFTADGTVDAAVEGILDYFDQYPDAPYFSLGVNDSGGYCEDDPSHPDYPDKKNSIGLTDMSDIYYGWVNEVVERVLEVYPDKWFGLLSYQQVMDPPSFSLNPHVIPVVTKDRLSWIDEDVKEKSHQRMDAWKEVASQVAWYDYMYGTYFALPRVYPHQMAENFRYADAENVYGTHTEMRFNAGDGPKSWLYAKLQWNPNQDVDALLDEWYVRAVGEAAAPDLAAYFDLWEDFWTERIKDSLWFKSYKGDTYLSLTDASYMDMVTDEDIAESKRLLASVVEKAQTTKQQERAKQLQRMFEYYEASAKSYPRQVDPPEDANDALAMLDNLGNGVDFNQKRYDLIKEFEDEPALKISRDLRVDWTGWNSFEYWHLVDYMDANESNGGPVTDKVNAMAGDDEPSNMQKIARLLQEANKGMPNSLAKNPSFEEGDESDPSWEAWIEGQGSIERAEGIAHSGKASILVDSVKQGGPTQTFNIQPGLFATRVYFYTPPGTETDGRTRLTFNLKDAEGTILSRIHTGRKSFSSTAGEWSSLELIGDIPAVVNNKKVEQAQFVVTVDDAEDAQVYVDDAVFFQAQD